MNSANPTCTEDRNLLPAARAAAASNIGNICQPTHPLSHDKDIGAQLVKGLAVHQEDPTRPSPEPKLSNQISFGLEQQFERR